MSWLEYLDGYVYHMVHVANIHSIFNARAILSSESLQARGIRHRSIAYDDVQELRDRIFVWDSAQRGFSNLHRYVPFYFAIHPPMLHAQHNKSNQEQIVFLEVQRAIIRAAGVLFTDGNAATQKLSRKWGESVKIFPATVADGLCHRQYIPNGPYGKGTKCSDFYHDEAFLPYLNWDVINGTVWMDDWYERQRIRSAEVLIPDQVPLQAIQVIGVRSVHMMNEVNQIIASCGVVEMVPSAVIEPRLFLS